jgi:hypothetical protein
MQILEKAVQLIAGIIGKAVQLPTGRTERAAILLAKIEN